MYADLELVFTNCIQSSEALMMTTQKMNKAIFFAIFFSITLAAFIFLCSCLYLCWKTRKFVTFPIPGPMLFALPSTNRPTRQNTDYRATCTRLENGPFLVFLRIFISLLFGPQFNFFSFSQTKNRHNWKFDENKIYRFSKYIKSPNPHRTAPHDRVIWKFLFSLKKNLI